MKALVLWAKPQGNANLGVSVLAEGAAELARRAWGPRVSFEFQEFASTNGYPGFTRKKFALDALALGHGPVRRRLSEFDVVLDTGAGDSFTDHYGLSRLSQIVYAQRAARSAKVPLFMMPQTIGPFRSSLGKSLGRTGLRAATGVFARDSTSVRAAQAIGGTALGGNTDVVFALPRPAEGPKEFDVLLNVSGLLAGPNPHVDSAVYRRTVLSLVRHLKDAGRSVTLLPHVVGPEVPPGAAWGDNDVPAVRAIASELKGQVDTVVPRDLTHVRELVSSAAVVVGSRMHACLNALSVGTAAIPLAYSRKFAPLLSDIGWDYSIDLRTTQDPATDAARLVLDDIQSRHSEIQAVSDLAGTRTENMVQTLRENHL